MKLTHRTLTQGDIEAKTAKSKNNKATL